MRGRLRILRTAFADRCGRVKMKKLRGLSEREVEDISRQIADSFYDYRYN